MTDSWRTIVGSSSVEATIIRDDAPEEVDVTLLQAVLASRPNRSRLHDQNLHRPIRAREPGRWTRSTAVSFQTGIVGQSLTASSATGVLFWRPVGQSFHPQRFGLLYQSDRRHGASRSAVKGSHQGKRYVLTARNVYRVRSMGEYE